MAYETHPSALASLEAAHDHVRGLLRPPPEMTVSQWAERNRLLPKGTTSRPGPFRAEKFQREIMDVYNDPTVKKVVFMKSTQVGGSDATLLNIMGYIIDIDPKPIMMVMPGGQVVKEFGRKRLMPMLQSTPSLRGKVTEAKSRDSGNTLTHKFFAGGFLKLANAGSGKELRSDPIPVLLLDEVDGYDPISEGDPVDIAERRTDQYPDAKTFYISTPAKPKWTPGAEGCSRIEELYEKSDKRRFHVPCPHCGHMQPLSWRDPETKEHRMVWDKDEDGFPIPGSVRYVCAGCGQGIKERFKQAMLDQGEWIAERPGREIIGFHINALYSPWKENWDTLALEWVEAQGNPEKLRAFINLRLGETYENMGDGLDAKTLRKGLDGWKPVDPVPGDVACLTLQVDVQKDGLVATIEGHCEGGRMRLLHHDVLWGDPITDPGVWDRLEELRLTEWLHESGKWVRPVLTFVDSGGKAGATDAVYDYVQPRQGQRVFAIKGVDYHTRNVLVQRGSTKRATVELFTVATHTAKSTIFARLQLPAPEPGQPHPRDWIYLPGAIVTDEYLAQLVGERAITVTDRRTRTRKTVWVKTHNRNEALDLKVYALAAIWTIQNILDPITFRDLSVVTAALRGEVAMPRRPGRRVRNQGVV